ncbi:MAG: hypothetical protein HOQ28_04585 [Thermoleophilia bacterium]|nr:hypothetical protein [Thermoleophilia bacterium]
MNDDFEESELEMTTMERIGATAVASPLSTKGAPATGGAVRLRPAAILYLCCVLALAVGGALLGVRLLQTGSASTELHVGPSGLGVPFRTSFGSVEVESVAQIRGLTPKALAGMTHGIHSLVKADQMQVQLVLALRNARGSTIAYDPADFVLRLERRGGKSKTYESASTSVRAGRLSARSAMETTVGFVIPRFNPNGTRLSLEFRERGRSPLALDLGPVRPGGSLAAVQAALRQGHNH